MRRGRPSSLVRMRVTFFFAKFYADSEDHTVSIDMRLVYGTIAGILLLVGSATAQLEEVLVPSFSPELPYAAIEWADSSTGFVFDEGGRYIKTSDGGATWKADSLPFAFIGPNTIGYRKVHEVDFRTRDFGVVVFSRRHDTLFYAWTENGGSTWTPMQTRIPGRYGGWVRPNVYLRPLHRNLWFLQYGLDSLSTRLYNPALFQSTNQGQSWERISVDPEVVISYPDVVEMHTYVMLDALRHIVFIGTTGRLSEEIPRFWARGTFDGGRTWITQEWNNGQSSPLEFRAIRMTSDTSFSMIFNAGSATTRAWTPGPDAGTAPTIAVAWPDRSIWTSRAEVLPRPGRLMRDFLSVAGNDYAIISTQVLPNVFTDSLYARKSLAPTAPSRVLALPGFGWLLSARTNKEIWIATASKPKQTAAPAPIAGVETKLLRYRHTLVGIDRPASPSRGSIDVYPQPARSGAVMHLSTSITSADTQLSVHDVHGRTVFAQTIAASSATEENSFTLPTLPAGMYMLRLSNSHDARMGRVVVVR